MPRAKANPDPMVVTHERPDMPGVLFTVEATRQGAYYVRMPGREGFLFARAAQPVLYPSNRMQQEAIEIAVLRINSARPDQLR